MTITPVGKTVSKWGEGPIWHDNSLYYVDINGHKVHHYDPHTGAESSWDIGERVGMIVPRKSGGFVIGTDSGLYFFDPKTGEKTAIADPEPDKKDNRFNDGKCSPDGRFFAGTISLVKNTGDAALYRLDPDLSVHVAYDSVTNSNGIAWSGDGKTCYYIDTPTRSVLAFDYDSESGLLTNPRKVIDTNEIDASPDGMTIDTDGNLWIAFCHGACVANYDPESGKLLKKVDLPCLETTSCAFGGPNLDELYVTTGIHSSVEEELAGRLFRIIGLGVQGRAVDSFAG